MNVPPDDDAHNDSLDRLLGEARWPEADDVRLARLERHWRQLRSRHLRRRTWQLIAVAATLALVALGLRWLSQSPDQRASATGAKNRHQPPHVVETDEESQNEAVVAQHDAVDHPGQVADSTQLKTSRQQPAIVDRWSRPPNAYESLVFRSHLGRTAPPRIDTPEQRRLAAAIDRLVTDETADAAALAAPLADRARYYETLLQRTLRQAPPPERRAAAQLLAYLGSYASVPHLVESGRRPETRAASTHAISRILDPPSVGRLAAAEPNLALQAALIAALLEPGDETSVAVYLDLVAYRPTTDVALAVLDTLPKPPTDALFEYLKSERRPQRICAARALGRINGPETARRLIKAATTGPHPQEALLALLDCKGPEAAWFLAYAEEILSLRAALNGARCEHLLLNQ